jgi:protein-arginine kinase activator protein McsA
MKKECQVCFEYYPTSLFPKITAKCNHRSKICKLCASKHISTKLNSHFDVEINCPFDGCSQKIHMQDKRPVQEYS